MKSHPNTSRPIPTPHRSKFYRIFFREVHMVIKSVAFNFRCYSHDHLPLYNPTDTFHSQLKFFRQFLFHTMLSSILIALSLLVTIATCQLYGSGLDNYPFFFGHQTGNSYGNSYAGNDLAGVYLFCNGIGCPGRG
uniref:Uncharacterized protein n=2 Tax=Caenorhabditis japonica TaxID=281687 RepID=K7HKS0_CAEJA